MSKKVVIPIVVVFLVVILFYLFFVSNHSDNLFNKNQFDEISYHIPSEFDKDGDYFYSRYYNHDDNSVYCTFKVNVTEKDYYDGLTDWFKGMISFNLNDKVGELKEVTVNGTKMSYVDKKSNSVTEYYYGAESSNYYYLLIYSIYDYENGDRTDLDSNFCYNAKDKILSSVKIK